MSSSQIGYSVFIINNNYPLQLYTKSVGNRCFAGFGREEARLCDAGEKDTPEVGKFTPESSKKNRRVVSFPSDFHGGAQREKGERSSAVNKLVGDASPIAVFEWRREVMPPPPFQTSSVRRKQ